MVARPGRRGQAPDTTPLAGGQSGVRATDGPMTARRAGHDRRARPPGGDHGRAPLPGVPVRRTQPGAPSGLPGDRPPHASRRLPLPDVATGCVSGAGDVSVCRVVASCLRPRQCCSTGGFEPPTQSGAHRGTRRSDSSRQPRGRCDPRAPRGRAVRGRPVDATPGHRAQHPPAFGVLAPRHGELDAPLVGPRPPAGRLTRAAQAPRRWCSRVRASSSSASPSASLRRSRT